MLNAADHYYPERMNSSGRAERKSDARGVYTNDSRGDIEVPADRLWGPPTVRSLEHFSIGQDLIPRETISAYAILKKGAANANHAGSRVDDQRHKLIDQRGKSFHRRRGDALSWLCNRRLKLAVVNYQIKNDT
jgi:hypothetical protein